MHLLAVETGIPKTPSTPRLKNQQMEARLPGDQAKVIEGVAEPVALPAPSRKPRRKRGAEAKASPLLPDEQGESE